MHPGRRLGPFYIELFAGSECVAGELRKMGATVYTFDVLQGPAGDLLRRAVRRRIYRLLRSGMCLGVMAGVPCTSFSRARGGGDRAIRSMEHPEGRPGMSDKVQRQLDEGNRLLQISCSVFTLCWKLDVPFVWENREAVSCGNILCQYESLRYRE